MLTAIMEYVNPKKVLQKKQSVNEIIEEIHNTFDTEVDRLLAEANISRSLDTDKQALIDKCRRLRMLGFKNTKEIVEAEAEINRLNALKEENKSKQELIRAIEYFSVKYMNYKFITEESVLKICQKYNLIYGTIDRYIGTVPDKNLKHMEDFKIKQEDACYIERISSFHSSRNRTSNVDFKTVNSYNDTYNPGIRYSYVSESRSFIKSPMEIAAPLKDFNTKDMDVKNFKLSKVEIPDPVVLQPVMFNKKKYYLIVTAWGLESNDDLVMNPIHN